MKEKYTPPTHIWKSNIFFKSQWLLERERRRENDRKKWIFDEIWRPLTSHVNVPHVFKLKIWNENWNIGHKWDETFKIPWRHSFCSWKFNFYLKLSKVAKQHLSREKWTFEICFSTFFDNFMTKANFWLWSRHL